ncbi:MAG: PKD domain-containing protein, partial [Thermoleophilaceae bacterium]
GSTLVALALLAAVALANNAPQASFTYSPAAPKPGEQVMFTSTSTDSDGTIARTSWDLDGNGTFETTGTTATHTFAAEGTYTVTLQVADDGGALDTDTKQITVANPPPQPPPVPPPGPQPSGLITFEENPAGTVVHSQYANQGVQLGYTNDDPSGQSGAFPIIVGDPGAHSGGHVAKTPPCGAEFCSNTIYGRFDNPRSHVEVYAGGGAKVALLGFTAQGALVSQDFKQTGLATQTKLVLNQNLKRLSYFSIGENAPIGSQFATVKIDDLSFDPPDPNAAGDFAVSWTPQLPFQTIDVSPGSSETTQVKLTRLNGYSGPVQFSVGNKPAGVTATITPNPASNAAVTTATLKISAAANAPSVNKASLGIHAKPASGPDADPLQLHNTTVPMRVILSNYDVQVTGIEVNQAIQATETPYYTPGGSLSPSICASYPSLPVRDMIDLAKPVPYETFTEEPLFPQSPVSESFGVDQSFGTVLRRHGGVELARDRKTVVRVFANLAGPPGHAIADVPATLAGKRGGKALPGSPLTPDGGPLSIKSTGHPWVSCKDRGNALGAYTFTLPKSWAAGDVTLAAHVMPDKVLFGGGGECGTPICDANNSLSLSAVNFTPTSYVALTPLALALTDPATNSTVLPPPPFQTFKFARYITPSALEYGAGANDQSYAAVLDISDIAAKQESQSQKCIDALNVVEDWADDHPHADATVGVFPTTGFCAGTSDKCCHLKTEQESFSVVAANSPEQSVSHELFHGFGRKHASAACGATGSQQGDDWPPD